MATDADVDDMLTYTLWWGDGSGNLSKTDITATGMSGQSVTLEKSGLSNDTRYWFKVVVNDGIDEATSGEGNESTYCKGEYCNGVSYTNVPCTKCDSNHQIPCTSCGENGVLRCGGVLKNNGIDYSYNNYLSGSCEVCGRSMAKKDKFYYKMSCELCDNYYEMRIYLFLWLS